MKIYTFTIASMICQVFWPTASLRLGSLDSFVQVLPDQNRYDDRLQLSLGVTAGSRLRRLVDGRLRHFIWSHFRQHRRGYLIMKSFTKEGEPVTSKYYILPDESGTWRIEVLITRILSDRHTGKQVDSEDRYAAYDVRLVTPGSKAVMPDAPSSPVLEFMKSHALRMIDREGNVITDI